MRHTCYPHETNCRACAVERLMQRMNPVHTDLPDGTKELILGDYDVVPTPQELGYKYCDERSMGDHGTKYTYHN